MTEASIIKRNTVSKHFVEGLRKGIRLLDDERRKHLLKVQTAKGLDERILKLCIDDESAELMAMRDVYERIKKLPTY
jgi:hypothetical protein